MTSFLSNREKLFVASLRAASARAQFLASRSAMKGLLKEYHYLFNYGNRHGINNQHYYTSLSHTADCIALSVFSRPHGIDIEPLGRPIRYGKSIMRRCFSRDEVQYAHRFSLDENKRFLRLFTLKEAIAKYKEVSLGKSLYYDTVANPDHLLLHSTMVHKKYICGFACGDSHHEVLLQAYHTDIHSITALLAGGGQCRISVSQPVPAAQFPASTVLSPPAYIETAALP